MRRLIPAILIGVLALAADAAPEFPRLTGRVVDPASMISARAERQLNEMSAAHENATGNQLVVVTVPDLQGQTIEQYGYQLGRHWGIGQKKENNGVLLIVAKAERKIRIEVGYGLEGQLTDAISSNIISTVISPNFKRARFDQGLVDGSAAIIAALGGEYKMRDVPQSRDKKVSPFWGFLMMIAIFWILPSMFGRGGIFKWILLGSLLGGHRGRRGGFGGGGFGGGGFSGGGGSFGGGGASGGW